MDQGSRRTGLQGCQTGAENVTVNILGLRAWRMFRARRMSTLEIARELRVEEWEVYIAMHVVRGEKDVAQCAKMC